MPGKGSKVVSENVRREMRAGRPQKQAVAVALAKARRSGDAKTGAMVITSASHNRSHKSMTGRACSCAAPKAPKQERK